MMAQLEGNAATVGCDGRTGLAGPASQRRPQRDRRQRRRNRADLQRVCLAAGGDCPGARGRSDHRQGFIDRLHLATERGWLPGCLRRDPPRLFEGRADLPRPHDCRDHRYRHRPRAGKNCFNPDCSSDRLLHSMVISSRKLGACFGGLARPVRIRLAPDRPSCVLQLSGELFRRRLRPSRANCLDHALRAFPRPDGQTRV